MIVSARPRSIKMLATFLQNVCEMLHRHTKVPATLGEQAKDSAGLIVWPWKIVENVAQMNRRLDQSNAKQDELILLPPLDVHFLVLAQSGNTIAGLTLLEIARRATHEEPLILVNGLNVRLLSESIPTRELISIFAAIGLPLSPCLSIVGMIPVAPPESSPQSASNR